jgi:hypothetical protein
VSISENNKEEKMYLTGFISIFLLFNTLFAESDLYTKTKIKHRSKLQSQHKVFKESKYSYIDDHNIKHHDSKVGNLEVTDKKVKKVYNYVDVRKKIHINKSFEGANINIAKDANVKSIYNYVHIDSIRAKKSVDVGNMNIKQKNIHGKFSSIIEIDTVETK